LKHLTLPHSLARRMILILLTGFALIQLLGLLIHTLNQVHLLQLEEEQEFATRAVIIYRHIAAAAPEERAALLAKEPLPKGDKVSISTLPPVENSFLMPIGERNAIRAAIFDYGIPPPLRPHGLVLRMQGFPPRYIISFGLPDNSLFSGPLPPPMPPNGAMLGLAPPELGLPELALMMVPPAAWLTISSTLPPPAPWRSPGFATAFVIMTLLGGAMITWAVRQLLRPVKTLAAAAEALGRDVANAPPLPETGPAEIVTAARAFNTMAARVRRFVEDRTFLLTAIGHDLRTPITRLKLRAEYMEDEEQRAKMLADLDEMEAMVAATLAFSRDVTTTEPVARIDLASLLRTILDDAADGDPDHAAALSYTGPEHLPVRARPLALKRALANLIGNALKYGDAAHLTLHPPARGMVRIDIDDQGPGIPPEERERVFEPFRRLETSRNRETGGSGLGLAISRNIIRAHGGDVTLTNLPERGLRVSVTLPV
jgi:signal transduction histidine kinase